MLLKLALGMNRPNCFIVYKYDRIACKKMLQENEQKKEVYFHLSSTG
jgi:hypothetical protein